jgi:hypothetical protein
VTDIGVCPHCRGFGPSTAQCEHANWEWQGWDVCIPTNAVWHAINKARQLYVAVAAQEGRHPGPETEGWSEFEILRRMPRPRRASRPG